MCQDACWDIADIQCCLPSVRRWCVYFVCSGYGCASIGSPIIKQDAKCLCLKGSSFCDLGQLCLLLIVMASQPCDFRTKWCDDITVSTGIPVIFAQYGVPHSQAISWATAGMHAPQRRSSKTCHVFCTTGTECGTEMSNWDIRSSGMRPRQQKYKCTTFSRVGKKPLRLSKSAKRCLPR